ncbi:MAG: glycosyltransferase [Bacteroidales bacterium]|nr:glycosyltransferase [Bacteroidales bacterium]
MPVLLQIDTCLGIGSTGHISEGIGSLAKARGWECYIAHGARYVGKTALKPIQVGTKLEEYFHITQSLLFDNHGLASVYATKRLIKKIERIKPDVIQLHCIHGYYVNYKYLFEYLNKTNIPIIWTFHDCWAFTGHCAHFITANCYKWKDVGCHDCPLKKSYPRSIIDRSRRNIILKKSLFTSNKNLFIVTVSDWLASFARSSFLKDKNIRVINNGIDISKFKPCAKKTSKLSILGVATAWGKEKGLYDFFKLRELLPLEEYDIVLVGLTKAQINDLPAGIIGIARTESVEELAVLYSEAGIFVNPTYADSFPTVNLESLACGTPVITYRTGGSPETIDENTGYLVDPGDVKSIVEIIKKVKYQPLSAYDCRLRAEKYFNKDECFMNYILLYEQLNRN